MKSIELIDSLINQAWGLTANRSYQLLDSEARSRFYSRATMILSNILGKDTPYISRLTSIQFAYTGSFSSYMSDEKQWELIFNAWDMGVKEVVNLLEVIKEELALFHVADERQNKEESEGESLSTCKIFIVHGHNDKMKLSVARSTEKLGLEPIILHEQPNLGRTIIEKFQEYADVGFAIILLSPDDFGHPKNKPSEGKLRARQNVILELGYFLGKLGRRRVMALYLQEENFEMPSDFSGVLYVAFDEAGKWQFDLVKELKACGYEVDANRLV